MDVIWPEGRCLEERVSKPKRRSLVGIVALLKILQREKVRRTAFQASSGNNGQGMTKLFNLLSGDFLSS